MKDENTIFPSVKKHIGDFLFDQEGSVPRNKVLAVGAMMIVMGIISMQDLFARHSSHSSHRSHSSHSSHSSGASYRHSSHSSHSSGSTYSYPSHSSVSTELKTNSSNMLTTNTSSSSATTKVSIPVSTVPTPDKIPIPPKPQLPSSSPSFGTFKKDFEALDVGKVPEI